MSVLLRDRNKIQSHIVLNHHRHRRRHHCRHHRRHRRHRYHRHRHHRLFVQVNY